MLTETELATLRAALQFWREEMIPAGIAVMRPYFDAAEADPLTLAEIEELRVLLQPAAVRYAPFDPVTSKLVGLELSVSPAEVWRRHPQELPLAVVLVPR